MRVRSCSQYLKKMVDGKVVPPTWTFRVKVGNRDGWFLKKEIPACIDSLYEELCPVLQEMVNCFGDDEEDRLMEITTKE